MDSNVLLRMALPHHFRTSWMYYIVSSVDHFTWQILNFFLLTGLDLQGRGKLFGNLQWNHKRSSGHSQGSQESYLWSEACWQQEKWYICDQSEGKGSCMIFFFFFSFYHGMARRNRCTLDIALISNYMGYFMVRPSLYIV